MFSPKDNKIKRKTILEELEVFFRLNFKDINFKSKQRFNLNKITNIEKNILLPIFAILTADIDKYCSSVFFQEISKNEFELSFKLLDINDELLMTPLNILEGLNLAEYLYNQENSCSKRTIRYKIEKTLHFSDYVKESKLIVTF